MESEISAYQSQEAIKKRRTEYERAVSELNQQIKDSTTRNKCQANDHATSFNMQLSQYNVALEDLSRDRRKVIGELKDQRTGLAGFLTEALKVAENERDEKRDAFTMQGPRPIEQEQMDRLNKIMTSITAKLMACTKELVDVKKTLAAQDKVYSRRFGKQKVGTLSLAYNPMRVSIS
jgi:septal ring factor EnvC (AmiA/AmiB activator)